MYKYSRKYGLFIFIALTILLIQFLLALSFYASNQFEEQFLQDGTRFKTFQKHSLHRFTSDYLPSESGKLRAKSGSIRQSSSTHHSMISSSHRSSISGSKQSSSKNNPKLDLSSLGFIPNCTLTVKDAIYAINRAKTIDCKKELSNVACQMQSNQLFPKYLPQYCPYPSVKKKDSMNIYSGTQSNSVRIAFILTFNGRCVRQIIRLIKAIYSHRHIYFIHIDKRQDYLFERLLPLETLPNIKLSRNRLSTIWGGASLLEMLINSFSELMKYKNWDYVINLSESDFPIKSVRKLENFLFYNHGHNFVKSHGQDTQRFLIKQGLDKTFHQCENHMWRLGDRKIPSGIEVDGGSDWVALTRDFVQYIVDNDDELLVGLRVFFKYTLLPAETFFHTVLRNSAFCDTVIDNNLHVTNWRRSQGCKCQYRHIVDWCGCSPNDFKLEDWPRIVDSLEKPLFFARKFEASVNQEIINRIEMLISKAKGKVGQLGLNKYWENDYHHKFDSRDDAKHSFYYLLALLSSSHIHQVCYGVSPSLKSTLMSIEVKQGHIFFENDSFMGPLVSFSNSDNKLIETFAHPVTNHKIINRQINKDLKLVSAKVCSEFDMKEQIFRNFGCILNPFSEIGVNHRWSSDTRTNHSVSFVWVDPVEHVAGSFEVSIEWPQSTTKTSDQTISLYHKPNFNRPLRPGEWKLCILYKWKLLVEVKFLVLPNVFDHGSFLDKSSALRLHSGPIGAKYLAHNFTAVERLLNLRTNPANLDNQAALNSEKVGHQLIDWSLELLQKFWTIHDSCSISKEYKCLQVTIPLCQSTQWSSNYPDLKSKLI